MDERWLPGWSLLTSSRNFVRTVSPQLSFSKARKSATLIAPEFFFFSLFFRPFLAPPLKWKNKNKKRKNKKKKKKKKKKKMSRDSVPLFLEKRSWWFVALPEIYLAGCASLCFFFLDSKEDAERRGTRVESYSKLNRRSRTFLPRFNRVPRSYVFLHLYVYTMRWIWAALVF